MCLLSLSFRIVWMQNQNTLLMPLRKPLRTACDNSLVGQMLDINALFPIDSPLQLSHSWSSTTHSSPTMFSPHHLANQSPAYGAQNFHTHVHLKAYVAASHTHAI